jgi:hypothetical protein
MIFQVHVDLLKQQQQGMKILIGVHKLDFCKVSALRRSTFKQLRQI